MDFGDALDRMIGLATGSKDPVALNAVMEVQRQLVLIQEENRKLRFENEEMKNEKILSSQIEHKNNAYYKKGEDIPYCTRCYDVDKKLVTMSARIRLYSDTYTFVCPNCKNEYDSGVSHGQNTSINL